MTKTMNTAPAAKDFSRTERASLARKGITIIGSVWLPGPAGDYINGERGYNINDNGTHRVRSYMQVRALAIA